MFFFFKQKTAYEMRISDWSSDVCSSDLKIDVDPAAGSQTPRTGNVDGATFQLTNVGLVDVITEYRVAGQRVVGARGPAIALPTGGTEIGRASGRERGCQYV